MEYLKNRIKYKNIINNLPVTEICEVLLDFLPMEDKMKLRVYQGGVFELYAWDAEYKQRQNIVINSDDIIRLIECLESLYPSINKEELTTPIKQYNLEPNIYFLYENFSLLDEKTKGIFNKLFKKFGNSAFQKILSAKYCYHIVCRQLGYFFLWRLMAHEYSIANKTCSGGYYNTLRDLSKLLAENKLVSINKAPENVLEYPISYLNNCLQEKRIRLTSEVIKRLNLEARIIREKGLLHVFFLLYEKTNMRRDMGFLTGRIEPVFGSSRGIISTLFISYVLEISYFNPIKYGIEAYDSFFSDNIIAEIDVDSENEKIINTDEVKTNPLDVLLKHKRILKLINKPRHFLLEIPLNDQKTLRLFKKAETKDIFNFDNDKIRKLLRKNKPKSFSDICKIYSYNCDSTICFEKLESIKKIDILNSTLLSWRDAYFKAHYQNEFAKVVKEMAIQNEKKPDIAAGLQEINLKNPF